MRVYLRLPKGLYAWLHPNPTYIPGKHSRKKDFFYFKATMYFKETFVRKLNCVLPKCFHSTKHPQGIQVSQMQNLSFTFNNIHRQYQLIQYLNSMVCQINLCYVIQSTLGFATSLRRRGRGR